MWEHKSVDLLELQLAQELDELKAFQLESDLVRMWEILSESLMEKE